MYEAVAKGQNVPDNLITGTCQNDILKEYTAQNEYIYLPVKQYGWSWTRWNMRRKLCRDL